LHKLTVECKTILESYQSSIEKHQFKAKSKFEDSLKPLSKTLKQEEKQGKKTRNERSPRNKNHENYLTLAAPPLARPCLDAWSCHPARPGRANFLADLCWWLVGRTAVCLNERSCLACFVLVALFFVLRLP